MQTQSEEAQYAIKFIVQTNMSVFLTGKAGTGKTTFLRDLIDLSHKNTVVVAPTGIAALNAGGVTIHSMFQLPFAGFIPDNSTPQFNDSFKMESFASLRRHFRMSGQKKAVIQNLQLLIIDEVSMLRPDVLDAIDFMLQFVRKKFQPFGGVQVLFIGDLLQLPPVIKDEEWNILQKYYSGKFFFHAQVIQKSTILYIELNKIYRQRDELFISILNNLRNNEISEADMKVLAKYVDKDFDLKNNLGYITLTTHNAKADAINTTALNDLAGKTYTYFPEIVGDFPEKIFPIDEKLQLKVGAQIMFIKNDLSHSKSYFNGKMGIVVSLSEKEILVKFPEEDKIIEVDKYEWENIKYKIDENTKEIDEEVLGTFVHYPIKLAWAITVHKSQGLTFDKAAIDVSQVFVPGQAYVALSRLRSLDGLVLLSPFKMNGLVSDKDVLEYASKKTSTEMLAKTLETETKIFLQKYIKDSFDWNSLAEEWRNHQLSYTSDNMEKSEKAKSANWAKTQTAIMWQIQEPAAKFRNQLQKLFANETLDLNYISQRIDAAHNYFFETMDNLLGEILWKMEEVKFQKKSKLFYEELLFLEELQTRAILQMLKTKLLLNNIVEGKILNKENMTSEFIKSYRRIKGERIAEDFQKANINLGLVDDKTALYETSKKAKNINKKSTIQETHELLLQGMTVKEIAKERKLTEGTIYTHLTKLIMAKELSIETIISAERIAELQEAFKGFTNENSLSELKEVHGERFSWDELRIYKASVLVNSTGPIVLE